MKKAAGIIPSLFILFLAIYYFFPQWLGFGKSPLYIAVAGPMSGAMKNNGQAMVKGIQMYLKKVNDAGGINGRTVKLRIFDDRNDVRQAMKVASEIEADNDILLVLGHYFSSTSIAAGRTYRKKGIPAITASATAESVTAGNDWYFRVVANNGFQGAFIAHYIKKALLEESVTIIYDMDQYGMSLTDSFEKVAKHEGMTINKKWGFASDHKKVREELDRIVTELRAMKKPGVIFLATHAEEAVQIISSLKYPGTTYTIVGPDSVSSDAFLNSLNTLPGEQSQPGYYSDGIYTVTPFMFDIADENAIRFRKEFFQEYMEEATWVSVCYYDAAYMALEAIRVADARGGDRVRQDRREIRTTLANIGTYEESLRGLSGYLYFDKNGDVNSPLSIGIYDHQKLYPAFSQYQMVSEEKKTENDLEKVLAGDMLLIGDRLMHKTKVVYTGIDINSISELDIRNSTYTVDFYLWFRYKGDFDSSNIQFINAVKSIRMKPIPLEMPQDSDMKVDAFEVTAQFKGDFDFRNYPCEHQILKIVFRHAELTKNGLIFVVDTRGIPESLGKAIAGKARLNTVTGWSVKDTFYYQDVGWYIKDTFYYQDVVSNVSTLGMPDFFQNQHTISYSQFNAAIRIERRSWGTVVRNFLPVFVIVLILYGLFYIPWDRQAIRVWIVMALVVTNAIYHVNLLRTLPVEYITILEWIHISLYVLICLTVFHLLAVFIFQRKKRDDILRRMTHMSKIVFPITVAVLALLIIHQYMKAGSV